MGFHNKLSSEKKVGHMWIIIRKSKRSYCPASAISLQRLDEYSTESLDQTKKTDVIEAAKAEVKEKYQACNECVYSDSVVTEYQGPSAPKSRKGNVRRICGGSRSYLKS